MAATGNAHLQLFRSAVHYWEWRRFPYNVVLTAVTMTWLIATWPHFRPAMTLHALLQLIVLAAIANIFYCAAYLADVPLQLTFGSAWTQRRWLLWWAGTIIAFVLTNYWIADEIYPFVN
jgi:hypothetical protein